MRPTDTPIPPAGEALDNGPGSIITPLGAISQGYAYEQTNWIRRGVTNSSGGVAWTDRIDLYWVTNPCALASRIDYVMRYPLNQTGFFGVSRATTRALTGIATLVGTGPQAQLGPGSATSKTVSNSSPMFNKTLWHSTTLSNVGINGVTYTDTQKTGTARCRPSPDRNCIY